AVRRSLSGFERRQAGSFRAWLRKITLNKIRSLFRDRSKQPRPADSVVRESRQLAARWDDEAALPDLAEDEATLFEERRLLYRRGLELVRQNFSDRDWEAFQRVVLHEERVRDVAESLGMTPNALSLAKSRILRMLRQDFRELLRE